MLKKFIAFSLNLCLFLATTAVFAHNKHENNQDVQVKTIKITDRVYMLQGRGGNVGALVGEDGILIVDDDYFDVAPKIAEALKALGTDKPRFVFNTHWHGDHTSGNYVFGKDAFIVSHTNVRKRLMVDTVQGGNQVKAYPKLALPTLTFDQSIRVHFNDEDVYAVHYPAGHTDGDSVIFFTKAGVVHMGDHFFLNRFPFVDLQSGGTVQGLMKNISDVIAKTPADAKIIPGHGALATLDDLKNYNQMLIETTTVVRQGMTAGKTLQGLKQAGLPEKYQSWGTGFIKTDTWIETIYRSFSAK